MSDSIQEHCTGEPSDKKLFREKKRFKMDIEESPWTIISERDKKILALRARITALEGKLFALKDTNCILSKLLKDERLWRDRVLARVAPGGEP